MKKRICAALLTLAVLAGTLPAARAEGETEPFSDIRGDEWYAQGALYCQAHGILAGGGKRVSLFTPWQELSRAQLATILWRMAGEPRNGLSMQYGDVPEDVWYTEAVRWTLGAGIMDGYTYVSFGPDDPVTREQFAAMLWKLACYQDGPLPEAAEDALDAYGDRAAVDGDAVEAMRWVCATGIVTGQEDRYGNVWLNPRGVVSRAAAATILMRFCLDLGMFDTEIY